MNVGAEMLRKFFQSQQDVAPKLGIDPSMLSLLLAGKRKPSIEVAAAIEVEFGVPCRTWVEELPEPASDERAQEPQLEVGKQNLTEALR